MPTYRLTHCFQGNGGTTQDMYCNQFYFFSTTHQPADAATWGPQLAAVVHQLWAVGGNPPSLSFWYAPRCLGNLGITRIYDVTAGGLAGAPIFSITDEVLVPSSDYLPDCGTDVTPLPEEVAVCLSYQAVHTEGDLPRRRGRIYLGPFNTLAIDTSASSLGPTQVATPLMNRILASAQVMQQSAAAQDFEWRVFSTMDGFAFKIVLFSVDNAFDTIRGRGGAPTGRISQPIL